MRFPGRAWPFQSFDYLDVLALVPNSQEERCMNIYVGNIPFSATADDLRKLFEAYGEVETIKLITDRETGRPRGFGFVAMPNAREGKAAISGLSNTALAGRTLRVNEAKPRQPREYAR
jgi:RNA recognition motif-containing protein